MIDKNKIQKLLNQKIEETDRKFFVVDLSINNTTNKITVEIDHEEKPVSIIDCITFSRQIERNLDRETEDFELEVASAGLSNPFKVYKQYLKNKGKEIKVILKSSKVIEGELIEVDKEGIIVKTQIKEKVEGKKKKQLVIKENKYNFDEINQTKIVIKFK